MRFKKGSMGRCLPVLMAVFVLAGISIGFPANANAVNEVFWADPVSETIITDLALFLDTDAGGGDIAAESRKVLLVADIPAGEELSAFQFTITYPDTLVTFSNIAVAPTSPFAANTTVNAGTPGTIIINGFLVGGQAGPAIVPLAEATATAIGLGNNTVSIQVDSFLDNDLNAIVAPGIVNTTSVAVSNTVSKIFWTDADGNTVDPLDVTTTAADYFFNVTVPNGQVLRNYDFTTQYNNAKMQIDPVQVDTTIGPEDFTTWQNSVLTAMRENASVQAINPSQAGTIIFNGFSTGGFNGPQILRLIKVPFIALNAGQDFDVVTSTADSFSAGAGGDTVTPPADNTTSASINGGVGVTITVTAGANGTITFAATPVGPNATQTFGVLKDSTQNYTVSALTGFQIASVTVDGAPVAGAAGQTTFNGTFTAIQDLTVAATFTTGGVTPPPPPPPIPAPIGNFTGTPLEGQAPLTVQFTDQSSGTITGRTWDFGDGDTSTALNPEHTYDTPGTYTVTLTVFGPGGSDVEVKTGYITVTEEQLPAGQAIIRVEYNVEGDPFQVRLTDDSVGSTSRVWQIDGVEVGNGLSSILRTFAEPGTYTVTLTASGTNPETNEAYTDTTTIQIVVTDSGILVPVFEFSVSDLTVTFTDQSVPAGSITGWAWDFGDGNTSTVQNPTHTYGAPDTYTVTLTITTAGGATAQRTQAIQVGVGPGLDAPIAEFTASPTSGMIPLTVQFTSTSTNPIASYVWNFGDGGVSFEQNPSYTYTAAGDYTVSLTVIGPGGSDTETKAAFISAMVDSATVVNPPVPSSPQDGATNLALEGFHLVDALVLQAYADADNTYGVTRWEVAGTPNFAEVDIVWRETNTATSLYLPNFVVNFGETYYWRAKFIDVAGRESEYSEVFSFTVAPAASDDADANGILDDQAADCASAFPNIAIAKCVQSAVSGGGVFGVELVENVSGITFLRAFGEEYVPSEFNMPWGLIGFKLMTNVGMTTQITIHLTEAAGADAEWYVSELWPLIPNKRAGSSAAEWAADRRSVTLTLVDGGPNDFDGIANGAVVVPFTGFGVSTGEPVCCDDDGGGDTCFIGATAGAGVGGFVWLLAALVAVVSVRIVLKK